MPPRAIWTGAISFGLVNIPVRLYPATDSHQLAFHQFDAKTNKRVRYRRVLEGTDKEVPFDQIVDGYELAKNKIVILTDEEMAAAEPRKTRSLDIETFVPLESIDPIVWNHTYYVAPETRAGGQKAYAVLRDAMKQAKRVAIGRFVMRSKEYLATLRPLDRALALETMFFADEIRDVSELPGLPAASAASAKELEMAKKLVESFVGSWRHEDYKDSYRDRLLATIRSKAKGETIEPALAAPAAKVIDLMEALKQSLKAGKRSPAEAPGPKGRAARSKPEGRDEPSSSRVGKRGTNRRPSPRATKKRVASAA